MLVGLIVDMKSTLKVNNFLRKLASMDCPNVVENQAYRVKYHSSSKPPLLFSKVQNSLKM